MTSKYTETEQAYKNGYEKGLEDAFSKVHFSSAYNFMREQKPIDVFPKYQKRYREDFSTGKPQLVVDGNDDLFTLIQVSAPGQEIYNIIDRYANLSDFFDDISSRPNRGVCFDSSAMPSDLRDAYELLSGLRERFDDVAREQFDGSFGDFLEAVKNNDLQRIFNDHGDFGQDVQSGRSAGDQNFGETAQSEVIENESQSM